MGMVSLGQARRAGYKPCSLAVWATIIGWTLTVLIVLVPLLLLVVGVIGAANSTSTGY
jgi:hypothetical protein